MFAEQSSQRAEGSGSVLVAVATLQTRTCNRNVTKGRTERERGLALAPETCAAGAAAAVVIQEGSGLGCHDAFLEPPEQGLGLVERKTHLFQLVMSLVQHPYFLFTGVALSSVNP